MDKEGLLNHFIPIFFLCLTLGAGNIHAQLTDGVTGLLHILNAEMQRDGTFMLGGNFLNKHNLPNQRMDYPLNSPAIGLNFRPAVHDKLNLIIEYDARTMNVGALYSLGNNHFTILLELQQCRYISAGLVYKINLLKSPFTQNTK